MLKLISERYDGSQVYMVDQFTKEEAQHNCLIAYCFFLACCTLTTANCEPSEIVIWIWPSHWVWMRRGRTWQQTSNTGYGGISICLFIFSKSSFR
jgi:hypothetical protein